MDFPHVILVLLFQVELNQGGVDVYDFLGLVSTGDREISTTSCLGAEIDDLEMDDEEVEWDLSPDVGKFSPTRDQEDASKSSGWETVAATEPNSWSGWERDQAPTQRREPCDWSNKATNKTVAARWSSGNAENCTENAHLSQAMEDDVLPEAEDKITNHNVWSSWGTGETQSEGRQTCDWDNKVIPKKDVPRWYSDTGDWTGNACPSQPVGPAEPPKAEDKTSKPNAWSSWGRVETQTRGSEPCAWDSKVTSRKSDAGWSSSNLKDSNRRADTFQAVAPAEPPAVSHSCAPAETPKAGDETPKLAWSSWQRDESQTQGSKPCDWDTKATPSKTVAGWSSSNVEDWPGNAHSLQEVADVEPPAVSHSWDQQKSPESSHGWISQVGSKKQASDGWESSEKQHQWGQQSGEPSKNNRFQGSKGRGPNTGEWKSKKNWPNKSSGPVNTNSSGAGLYTATKQRLDIFTSEEEDALSTIEPIMLSIRRIIHQSGYVF